MTFGERNSHAGGSALRRHASTRPGDSGFSLIEITLAIGVIAFALVAILGLFPVAARSAVESQRETRAALIAQQIFADLRAADGSNRFLVTGPDPLLNTNGVNIAQPGTTVIAYDQDGRAVTSLAAAAFSNSYRTGNATILAQIIVSTNTGISNLSRAEATIQAPAAAPSTNRSSHTFVTLLNY